jgi:HEAT repeat protein
MLREAAAQSSTVELPQDRLFRLQVAEAMFKLGDRDAGYTIHGALYPANREEFEAAVLATQILGEVGDREAVQQLVNLVEARAGAAPGRDPRTTAAPGAPRAPYLYPPELRLAAATALAKLGYPDGVYVAEDFVAHQDPLLRAQTAFLLAQTPEPSSAQRLKTLVNDPSPLVQVAAASGLLTWLDTHADFSDVPHAAALGGR